MFQEIDTKLTENIKYLSQVSTGQPHEGSSYASQKVSHSHILTAAVFANVVIIIHHASPQVLQMAWHRLEHARSRVAELDR